MGPRCKQGNSTNDVRSGEQPQRGNEQTEAAVCLAGAKPAPGLRGGVFHVKSAPLTDSAAILKKRAQRELTAFPGIDWTRSTPGIAASGTTSGVGDVRHYCR